MFVNTVDRASCMLLSHTTVGAWPYSEMKIILFMGATKSLACKCGRLHMSPVVAMSRKCAKFISIIGTDSVFKCSIRTHRQPECCSPCVSNSPTARLYYAARSHFCELCINFTLEQVLKAQGERRDMALLLL